MSDTNGAPRRRAAANFGAPALSPIQDIQPVDPTPEPDVPAPRPVAVPAAESQQGTANGGEESRSRSTSSPRRSTKPSKDDRAVANEVTGKADQPIQVSLPQSLMERLNRFKKEKGLSHPTILFDAIESNADRLPDLVKARIVQVGGATGKSLFNRPQTVVPRSSDTEPKETFIIRVSQENKDILDQLAQDSGAPSRTVLLVAAYDAYLPN